MSDVIENRQSLLVYFNSILPRPQTVVFFYTHMNFFTKIIEKAVYVDTLQDYRKVKVWDFHLLDKVFVTETLDHATKRHPSYKYWPSDKKEKPVEGIVIWLAYQSTYTDDLTEVKFEKASILWRYDNDTKIVYKIPGYKILRPDWKTIEAYTLKKSHGEFQETFEHMEILDHKKQQAIRAREAYEKSLQEVSDELEKWKKLQDKMYDSLLKSQK